MTDDALPKLREIPAFAEAFNTAGGSGGFLERDLFDAAAYSIKGEVLFDAYERWKPVGLEEKRIKRLLERRLWQEMKQWRQSPHQRTKRKAAMKYEMMRRAVAPLLKHLIADLRTEPFVDRAGAKKTYLPAMGNNTLYHQAVEAMERRGEFEMEAEAAAEAALEALEDAPIPTVDQLERAFKGWTLDQIADLGNDVEAEDDED